MCNQLRRKLIKQQTNKLSAGSWYERIDGYTWYHYVHYICREYHAQHTSYYNTLTMRGVNIVDERRRYLH